MRRPRRASRSASVSFGFKYGAPRDADLVFDVRFLPNPHWVEELRPLPGHRAAGAGLRAGPASSTRRSSSGSRRCSTSSVPGYVAEGKTYLTIAIGCTGGRHRSVVVAEELGRSCPGAACRSASPPRPRARPEAAGDDPAVRSIASAVSTPCKERSTHDRQDRHQRLRPHRPQLLPRRQAARRRPRLRGGERPRRRRHHGAPAEVRLGARHATRARSPSADGHHRRRRRAPRSSPSATRPTCRGRTSARRS